MVIKVGGRLVRCGLRWLTALVDDNDKEDAVEVTLREGIARCRERKLPFDR